MNQPGGVDPIAQTLRKWTEHGWDHGLTMSAITTLMRVDQIWRQRYEQALAPLGLTLARWEILVLLEFSRRRELPLGKISARLQVHPTSVTSAVDRLEKQGFIERKPHETDRRTMLAVLTESGRAVIKKARDVVAAEVFERQVLDAEEEELLISLLNKIRLDAGDIVETDRVGATRVGDYTQRSSSV